MKPEIILASASPRRLEILEMFGLSPVVQVSNVDETIEEEMSPDKTVLYLSRIKGEEIAKNNPDSLVVSADTVVAHLGEILGKPRDDGDAFRMLKSFSGKTHEVWTGYSVFYKGRTVSRAVLTNVTFKSLSNDEINAYIKTGECRDKAGSYGAQSRAAVFVEKIDGDFFNVVGFPLSDFYTTVRNQFGINLW